MVRQILTNALTMATPMVQPKSPDLAQRIAGAVDTIYGVVPEVYGAFVQGAARPAAQILDSDTNAAAKAAEQFGQTASSAIDKPIGKAFGITGKETYQKPLGGITEPIVEQINKMFNAMGMTPEQISETLKSKFNVTLPPEDIRNMVLIGSAAVTAST
jgi:hypothetical protein